MPVGEDQLQHIQLTQHLIRVFNNKFGLTFPNCHAMIENQQASRIRSLRNPSKKMSKSDLDTKATINIRDEPDVIVEKIKKAVTDFTSDVSFEPEARPGVSNLVAIHSLVTDTSIEKIVEEAKSTDTGRYKLCVAEAVVEHLKPIRNQIEWYLSRRNDLTDILDAGAAKAREIAQNTLLEVKQKMGLGTFSNIPQNINMSIELLDSLPETKKSQTTIETTRKLDAAQQKVPQQKLRVEKKRTGSVQYSKLAPQFELSLENIQKKQN